MAKGKTLLEITPMRVNDGLVSIFDPTPAGEPSSEEQIIIASKSLSTHNFVLSINPDMVPSTSSIESTATDTPLHWKFGLYTPIEKIKRELSEESDEYFFGDTSSPPALKYPPPDMAAVLSLPPPKEDPPPAVLPPSSPEPDSKFSMNETSVRTL